MMMMMMMIHPPFLWAPLNLSCTFASEDLKLGSLSHFGDKGVATCRNLHLGRCEFLFRLIGCINDCMDLKFELLYFLPESWFSHINGSFQQDRYLSISLPFSTEPWLWEKVQYLHGLFADTVKRNLIVSSFGVFLLFGSNFLERISRWWWFLYIILCLPLLGEMIQIEEHIF